MSLGRTVALTDTGRKRRHNEDVYVVDPPIFAIADGMGGANAGEVAAALAADALRETADGGSGEKALVTLIQEELRNYEDRSVNLGFLTLHRLTGLTQFALVLMILVIMYFRREGILGRSELDESLRAVLRRLR